MRKVFGKVVKVTRPQKKAHKPKASEEPTEPENKFWEKLGSKVTVKAPARKASITKVDKKISGPKGKAKTEKVMHEFKEGKLMMGHSGGKVKDRKQAIAIALNETRKAVSGKKKRR